MELESFTFVLLRRGPHATGYAGEELAELQAPWLTRKGALG